MSLSQKGANYEGRDSIANPPHELREFAKHALRAYDDLASQIQAARSQANLGQAGPPAAPHPLTAISVVASGGFASIQLTHNNAPAGTQYMIELATTPNFQSPMRIDNGISLTHPPLYLKGLTLYFRAAPKFPASALALWLYLGGQNTPTAVTF